MSIYEIHAALHVHQQKQLQIQLYTKQYTDYIQNNIPITCKIVITAKKIH